METIEGPWKWIELLKEKRKKHQSRVNRLNDAIALLEENPSLEKIFAAVVDEVDEQP